MRVRSRHPNPYRGWSGSARSRPARLRAPQSALRGPYRSRPWPPQSRGIVWFRLARERLRISLRLSKPIAAETRRGVRRELFRARELGFPCHRTVFSPDFPAPAVYQATRTGQSLLGYGGFGAFLPTCGLTNRWKCRHRAPAFRFSGPLGMIKLTAFRTVGLSLLGIYFAAAARPAAADPSVQASPSGATTTYFAPSLGPAAAARVIDGDSGSNRNTSDNGRSDACAKCGACDVADQRQRQANPTPPPQRPPSCRRIR